MTLTKTILDEEIKKTKETIKTIMKMQIESKKKEEEIQRDCKVGLDINQFVLTKLEEQADKL